MHEPFISQQIFGKVYGCNWLVQGYVSGCMNRWPTGRTWGGGRSLTPSWWNIPLLYLQKTAGLLSQHVIFHLYGESALLHLAELSNCLCQWIEWCQWKKCIPWASCCHQVFYRQCWTLWIISKTSKHLFLPVTLLQDDLRGMLQSSYWD